MVDRRQEEKRTSEREKEKERGNYKRPPQNDAT